MIRNLLALIGLLALLAGGYGYYTASNIMSQFDPNAMQTYVGFAKKLLETKDPAMAMVYSVPVEEGLTVDDVKESMKSLAVANNFLFVGEAPFYKQYEAVTGKEYRHISFMSFCDVKVGAMMADYMDQYTAFMPCRISVVEGLDGKISLHTMSLDLMINGGQPLPPELKSEAERIWGIMQKIMNGAAKGEF